MDIEEAKEQLISLRENAKANIDTDEIFRLDYEAINIALNELEKKDKIIDLMAKKMAFEGTGRKLFSCDFRIETGECDEIECEYCIKKYFEKKAEEM